MNQDLSVNRKLFWRKWARCGKVENYNKIKDIIRKIEEGEDDMPDNWKKHFEDQHNVEKEDLATVNMYDFHGLRNISL